MLEEFFSNGRVARTDFLERTATEVGTGFVIHWPVVILSEMLGLVDPELDFKQPFFPEILGTDHEVPRESREADRDLGRVYDSAFGLVVEDELAGDIVERHLVGGGELGEEARRDSVSCCLAVKKPIVSVIDNQAIQMPGEEIGFSVWVSDSEGDLA